jgi:hypothetical protein
MNLEKLAKHMNPLEWLKELYGWVGVKHPAASLLVVTLMGAVVSFGVWKLAAYEYQKDVEKNEPSTKATQIQPVKTGNASTSGPESPAVTGDGNKFTYNQPDGSKKPKPKPPQ